MQRVAGPPDHAKAVASEDSSSSVTGAGAAGDSHRATRLLPFRGRKKRRDSSPGKRCVGDHANVAHHPKVLRLLAKHNESRVLFADNIFKVSREGKPKPRTLLLSGQALYLLKPETFKCSTRIALGAIAKVVLSHFADNFCLVKLKGAEAQNDLLFSCVHKTELVSSLVQGKGNVPPGLEVAFAEEVTYRFAAVYQRTAIFSENAALRSVHLALSEPTVREGKGQPE
eukprot:CAMPEP_0197492928 /NCGR_PEP_ID=MMETSP1311-20131121/16878_1 /TAXON_ID=464262 /ORGANISM="Genus nov. species nov., Strain RCC856" /LENGTH=226 /DNA_ID=CAMNT_0043038063 /DNA_START=149 /DNA_END=829 /DNA_ORIENTATION=+